MTDTTKTPEEKAATKVAPTGKTDLAGRRVKTPGEPPLASFVDKGTTPMIEEFVDYLIEQTGYPADPMSVQIGSSLRGRFQKSQARQESIIRRRKERALEAEAKAVRRQERIDAKAARAAARAEKAGAEEPKVEKTPAPKTSGESTPAAKSAPVAKAKPVAKDKAPSKKDPTSATTRRRPAAKTSATETSF